MSDNVMMHGKGCVIYKIQNDNTLKNSGIVLKYLYLSLNFQSFAIR